MFRRGVKRDGVVLWLGRLRLLEGDLAGAGSAGDTSGVRQELLLPLLEAPLELRGWVGELGVGEDLRLELRDLVQLPLPVLGVLLCLPLPEMEELVLVGCEQQEATSQVEE